MPRGVTIRLNRVEGMRLLAAKIRKEQDEYKLAVAVRPRHIRELRARILSALKEKAKAARSAKSIMELIELASKDVIEWQKRKDFSSEPKLRVCDAKTYLEMFQRDSREVIPVNSNSELWQMLQSPCEVK